MHGAANDFVLVDDRALAFPCGDRSWIASVAARRTGVGSEGILLIQPSRTADFRMRFFNPDGGEVDMCGNGARCVARLASEIGAAARRMSIETAAGLLEAEVLGNQVRLRMTPPRDWRLNIPLRVADREHTLHFVNSGVPHAVLRTDDLDATDVAGLGRAIRRHSAFAPAGTNANFLSVTGPRSIRIRTYERGVEAETLACGTGIVASALVAGRLGLVTPPVQVSVASGDVLTVGFELVPDGAKNPTLQGPAEHVFRGELDYAPTRA
jgi:diaminopimelate epimerase